MTIRSQVLARSFVLVLSAGLGVACGGGGGGDGGDKEANKGGGKGGKRGGKGGGKGGWGKGGDGGQAEALAVETVQVSPAGVRRLHRASGTLTARRSAEIRPVVSGIVRDLYVEEGDSVEAGQILARLDDRELKAAAARDRLAAKNAKAELERLEGIANADAVAKQEIDQLRYDAQSAKASAKLSKVQASQSVVRAPFAGTVTARHLDVGNLASSTSLIYELADLDVLELELYLPEREAAQVGTGAAVELELADDSRFDAKVIRRAPVVDPLTGTVKYTVQIDQRPAAAVPGAFVRAWVTVEEREAAPSLPVSSIFEVEGVPHVYTLVEGQARRVPVEVGLRGSDRVEVVGGLEPTQIVVKDAGGITDGMALKQLSEDTPKPDLAERPAQPTDASGS